MKTLLYLRELERKQTDSVTDEQTKRSHKHF